MPSKATTARAFLYAALDIGHARTVRETAARIIGRERAIAEGQAAYLRNGLDLIAVKALLQHGQFESWCRAELEYSKSKAEKVMRAAAMFGHLLESVTVTDLPRQNVAVLLSAPSTPEAVRLAYMPRIEAGERVAMSAIRAAVASQRGTADPEEDEADPVGEAHSELSADDIERRFAYVFGDDVAPIATPRTIDLSTFAKVRAIHEGTDSPGEKAAAAGRMEALASAAGLTVEEAVTMAEAPPAVVAQIRPADQANALTAAFSAVFDTPEFRARDAELQRQRAQRRAAALAEYGSEDAVWEPCARERSLETACRPVITRCPVMNGEIDTLQGWDGGWWHEMPPEAQAAVTGAYAVPRTVRDTLAEFDYWEKRITDQIAFDWRTDHPLYVRARVAFLEQRLDTLPAHSIGDLRARMAWMRYWNEHETVPDRKADRVRLATLSDDIERFAGMVRTRTDDGGDTAVPDDTAAPPDRGASFNPECWPAPVKPGGDWPDPFPVEDDESSAGEDDSADDEAVDVEAQTPPGMPRLNRHARRRAEKLKRGGWMQ